MDRNTAQLAEDCVKYYNRELRIFRAAKGAKAATKAWPELMHRLSELESAAELVAEEVSESAGDAIKVCFEILGGATRPKVVDKQLTASAGELLAMLVSNELNAKTRRSSRKKNPRQPINFADLKAAHKRFERLIVQEFGNDGPDDADEDAMVDYQVATDALISLDTIIHMIIDGKPRREIDSAIKSFYSSGEADSASVYIDIEEVLPRP